MNKEAINYNKGELDKLKPSIYNYTLKIRDGKNSTKTIAVNEQTFQKLKTLLTK